MKNKAIHLRLTLDIDYDSNGVSVDILKGYLHDLVETAANRGMMTGESEATVEGWNHEVTEINSEGSRCPSCGNRDIQGHGVEIDGNRATQEMDCLECDTHWTDIYILSSVEKE